MRTHIRKEVSSIAHQPAGSVEETRFEKIHNIIFSNSVTASISVAHEIADLIKKKQAEGNYLQLRRVLSNGKTGYTKLLVLYARTPLQPY